MDQAAIDQQVNGIKNEFNQVVSSTIEFLSDEYSKLQVGRAHPGIVEMLNIEAYGATQPLKNCASITIPDPKQIMIQPWDRSILGNIEKAIRGSDLNINPVNDGVVIRLILPELNEERRKELVKVVYKLAEEAKIRIRQGRHNAYNILKQMSKDKHISEDKLDWEERNIQKKVEESNNQIEEAAGRKEESVMKV
jgi:ribosome recycling factor